MDYLRTLCDLLGVVGKDKYQHFAIGAIIEAGTIVLLAWLLFVVERRTAMLIATAVGVAVVTAVELVKEFAVDDYADPLDIVVTLGGCLTVAVPITVYL